MRLGGTWRLRDGVPPAARVMDRLAGRAVARVSFDGRGVAAWDSALVTFVHGVAEDLARAGVPADFAGLPDGVQRLLALAAGRPEATIEPEAPDGRPILARVGETAIERARRARADVALLGDVTASLGRYVTGRARVRAIDVLAEMLEAGPRALPIVTVTSLLLGAIMAFVGAAALQPFGAGIYVANVVAISMLRELSSVMTAIVMAGRTGSSYAAELASMKLTQELDALETMGIATMDFLVLPRMLALSFMLPVLCVYSDLMGLVGGACVAVGMLDLTVVQYVSATRSAVVLSSFLIGPGKSAVFGVLVAFLGCRAGLRTGRSAAAVGRAATMAMVTAIVAIIVADGTFAVIFQVLDL